MMDKKPHIKPYIYGMLAGFGAISLSILFFFFIYRFDGFGDAVSKVTGILMPFIYGAVIAYLLKPVCNTIEGFLHRIFPEKLHSMANMLAIAATLLFGVLVVYALVMMVVPQLITSVTSLYYTAQTSITRFMRWVNTQEVFLDNETLMGYFNNAYDAIADNLTALRTTLLPSLQNIQGILSGVGVGVMSVVTWFKNLLIGLIVAVYLLASRKKFAKQAKMILYSVVKPHWAQLIQEEVLYADKMFGGFINGKITGAHKQLDKGRQVYAFGAGTQKMYDYLNDNPECMSAPVDYTNDIRSISALDNFISINNAVDIDLFGQVNAESAGVKHISGAGGQLDFVLGAYLSKGGKSFICLSSTFFNKKTGQLESRIRPTLENGSIITDTRANLHYLCTEYGCVNLKGLTTWEKAEALINVAHPDFREELIKEAEKMHIWRRSNKI